MRAGLDTNVLVYAHLPVFPESERVRAFLLARLADARHRLVVTPLVLHELVHVITDPRRFDPPVSVAEAVAVARNYVGKSNVECVSVDEESILLALFHLEKKGLGRKRIADTLLAATLLRHGIEAIITCNPSDFVPFRELDVIDPRMP